ncbi:hypothetical protein AC482_06890 [miscellaneous Crenarchaeota group-15 archaeon DG-45]|uniref:Large ribosomal subunit protein eL43 n=1 Tax=miscellaneous Crenarchaeota group-15 archaeon DG-45 TaxID=1685127 RepID=A0A0M0BLT7_9ARCH|nr:MAG: hypothetical protein AC482_06890 [miscellaneous Crenarchaeota group-15 archaeon DG-45]
MPRRKKSFGLRLRTRGGASVRKRWTRIMTTMKGPHKCPSCGGRTVKRAGAGIWSCTKCGYQFAGGAYQPMTKLGQTSMRGR